MNEMNGVDLNFNAATVEPAVGYEAVPTDWYPVVIEQSSMKPTKDKNGAYLELTMKIIGPGALEQGSAKYVNRKLFTRLNLQNSNPVAQEIAQKQLSAICHATNVIQLQNSRQLHGIPFLARAVAKPAEGGHDASNDVKGFKAIQAGTTAPVAGAPAAAPAWAQSAAVNAAPAPAAPVAQPGAAPYVAPVAAPAPAVAPAATPPWVK